MARLVVLLSAVVVVRDTYSAEMLREAGAAGAKLVVGADVVFGGWESMNSVSHLGAADTGVLVVFHRSPHRHLGGDGWYGPLLQALLGVSGEKPVTLVSHDRRDAFDQGLVAELEASNLGRDILFRPLGEVKSTLDLYSGSQVVVSQRMHPLIIACVLGIPCVGLRGSSKVAALCKKLGIQEVDPDDVWGVVSAVESCIADGVAPSTEELRLSVREAVNWALEGVAP